MGRLARRRAIRPGRALGPRAGSALRARLPELDPDLRRDGRPHEVVRAEQHEQRDERRVVRGPHADAVAAVLPRGRARELVDER